MVGFCDGWPKAILQSPGRQAIRRALIELPKSKIALFVPMKKWSATTQVAKTSNANSYWMLDLPVASMAVPPSLVLGSPLATCRSQVRYRR